MAIGWDEGKPTDNDIVSQFPANERAARSAAASAHELEHDDNDGRHKFTVGNTAARDAITSWSKGALFVNTSAGAVLQATTTVSATPVWSDLSPIPGGTKMLFFQSSVPTSWTQDTSQNDKVMRVVSGSGGGSAGNWTISGVTVDSHTISIAEMPAHTHTEEESVNNSSSGGGGGSVMETPTDRASGSTGGGGGHTHGVTADGNWRPAYIDVVVGTKD